MAADWLGRESEHGRGLDGAVGIRVASIAEGLADEAEGLADEADELFCVDESVVVIGVESGHVV